MHSFSKGLPSSNSVPGIFLVVSKLKEVLSSGRWQWKGIRAQTEGNMNSWIRFIQMEIDA